MKIRLGYLMWVLLCLSFSLHAQPQRAEIIYSGNIDGELEPCGCSIEGDLGGILRHATTLKSLRRQHPDLFALSTGGLIASMVPQDKLTGEYILKGFEQLDYDAVGVQWSDLAYGSEFITRQALPWISSNWNGEQFDKRVAIKRGEVSLTFFSWLAPAKTPMLMHGVDGPLANGMVQLTDALRQAQSQGLTVLATTLSLDEAQRQLPLQYIDILLIESAYEVYGEPQHLGKTLVLQPGSRGMRLGHLSLTMDDDGRIDSFSHEVISMPSSIEDDAQLLPWYDEYNEKVKAAYLESVEMRKAMESGASPFLGADGCRSCHVEAYNIWQNTLHSDAFARLEDVNKAFDPACIKCHTVGFEKQGGYIDIVATPQLMNVQCESCHGAGRTHAESAGVEPPGNSDWIPQQMCAQCHEKKHSPSFSFDQYWPRVMHRVVK